MHRRTLLAALAGALLLGAGSVGCAGKTTIEHAWRSPQWGGSFSHVAVFGMSKLAGVRRDYESRMAAALAEAGVAATPSFLLFPDHGEVREEEVARTLAEHGIDGALVTRLVAVDRDVRYVDEVGYAAMGGVRPGFYRPGFYDYYHYGYGGWGVPYSPGYTVEYTNVILETNLYDVASSELVWAGLSKIFDPNNVAQAIESYAKLMVDTLVRIGLLAPAYGRPY
ncbi:MAG: hypothetical protein R6X02_21400 [Enhygromyxa sp.]